MGEDAGPEVTMPEEGGEGSVGRRLLRVMTECVQQIRICSQDTENESFCWHCDCVGKISVPVSVLTTGVRRFCLFRTTQPPQRGRCFHAKRCQNSGGSENFFLCLACFFFSDTTKGAPRGSICAHTSHRRGPTSTARVSSATTPTPTPTVATTILPRISSTRLVPKIILCLHLQDIRLTPSTSIRTYTHTHIQTHSPP